MTCRQKCLRRRLPGALLHIHTFSRRGEIGRHERLKISFPFGSIGSSPIGGIFSFKRRLMIDPKLCRHAHIGVDLIIRNYKIECYACGRVWETTNYENLKEKLLNLKVN